VTRLERLRGSPGLLVYPLLALLSFPTFGALIAGQRGLGYVLDVFELPRSGVLDDWLANGLTLWNTHVTAGNALLAQDAISPIAPDVGLAFLVGPFAAYAIVAWLIATVAGIAMHLFLRDSLRLSTVAVVGGATIYLFGFWHFIYGFSAVAAPLVLWLIDRALVAGPGRWRFVLAGAITGGFLFYDGQSQVVLILAVVQLAYVLATTATRRDLPARLAIWAGTWVLALGLFGPVLLTQLVALPISQRTIWDLRALYDPRPLEAIGDTLRFYSPTVFGVPIGSGFGASAGRYGTYFLGAIGLPLLMMGIVGASRGRRERFLLALLVAIPLIDLGAVLLTPLQDHLGFLKSFQLVRIRHVLPFALAANAAIGLELVVRALDGRTLPWTGRRRGALVAASAIPLGIALLIAARNAYRLRHALVGLDGVALGWALVLAALLVGGVAIAGVVGVMVRRSRRPPDRAAPTGAATAAILALLLVAIAGERAVYAHAERLIDQGLGTWAEHLAVTPAQAFLQARPGIGLDRILTFGDDANRMGAVGLLQADGNQAIYPVTYHALFGALIDPQLELDPADATYYRSWGNRAITFGPHVDPEVVALVGARWLYVKGDEVPTVPGIVARFRSGDVTVYEDPDVLPRAFLATRLAVEPDPGAVVDRLAAASLADLRATAFVASGDDADALRGAAASGDPIGAGGTGNATITAYMPDRVEVSIAAGGPATLILTDVMAPGWTADRDGAEVSIATVDGAFRGVAVDAGTRTVVFRYRPTFTFIGLGLAFGSLAGAALWAVWLRRRDRRASGPSARLSAPFTPAPDPVRGPDA